MILGLLAGVRPPAAPSSGRAWQTWIGVPLAALLGVGLAAGFMLVPHLVLIAIEMVSIAMRNTTKTPESLAERINQAAIPGGFALAAVTATAGWISVDLRRSASGEPTIAPSRLGVAYRLSSFAAMLVLAWILVMRHDSGGSHRPVSWIRGSDRRRGDPDHWRGLRGPLRWNRGPVDGTPGHYRSSFFRACGDPPSWARFFWTVWLLAVIFIAVSRSLRELPELSEYVPVGLKTWMEMAVVLWNKVHHVAYPFATNSHVLLLPAVIWGLVVSFLLCGPFAPDQVAAFDVVARSSANLKRFLVPFAALSTLCLCALPTLFVMGLVVYHLRLMLLI